MKAIILAAGRGSRMEEMTDDRPKCLVEVRGRSLLNRQIDALRGAGIEDIAIVTGYRREMLATRGLVEFHNARWDETNMVSSLECAAGWLEQGPCLVSYSDIFYPVEAVRRLLDSPARLAVLYDTGWQELWTKRFGDPLIDSETFRLDDAGNVIEIGNRPTALEQVQGQYMGLLRFTPEAWREIQRLRADLPPAQRDAMHMTGTLQKIIQAGRMPVAAVPFSGEWGEVDSLEDLRSYTDDDPQPK